jgi:uroporphyrinogen decarboxylase
VLSLYGYNYVKGHIATYYNSDTLYVKGQEEIVKRFDPDILLTPLAGALEAETFGCQVKYFPQYSPNIRQRIIKEVKDFDKLSIPDVMHSVYVNRQVEIIKHLKENTKGEKPIGAITADPLTLLAEISGPEIVMELLIFRPEIMDKIIDDYTEYCLGVGRAYLEAGADFIIDLASLYGPNIVTEDMAKQQVYPLVKPFFEGVEGPVFIHHGGGFLADYIPIYKDLDHVMGFVIDSRDSIEKAFEDVLEHQTLIGNIQGPSLHKKTPNAIRKKKQEILQKTYHKNRFILFTSGADIPLETPEENLQAWFGEQE